MKKVPTCVLGAAVLAIFLAGCGSNSESDLSNTTVTGQVIAVDGNSVVVKNVMGGGSAAQVK